MTTKPIPYAALQRTWNGISSAERMTRFKALPLAEAQAFFLELSTRHQYEIMSKLPQGEQTVWLRLLDPDDAADLLQGAPSNDRKRLLDLLDDNTCNEVHALLKYGEDVAGGLMSPRFARLRPEMAVAEALPYVRKQALQATETIYTIYVLDPQQHLLGVTSLRKLFASQPAEFVSDIMRTNVVTVTEDLDQEQLSRLFAKHDLIAIPVVDSDNRMKGIVTIDDIVDVVQEEATEDIQKMGGSEPLQAPYLEVGILDMIRKRGGWLILLFLSEMLTANAMSHYQDELAKAVVLAVFIPLIISSGGNSGSQATTLVIRAMALGQLQLKDWWRVFRREMVVGTTLGLILGTIGLVRILGWQMVFPGAYGPQYALISTTVGTSLICIVLWGGLSGSMLPFVLKRIGFDPASASAPFVATLVDVTGLIIYFTTASIILHGTLL